MEDFVERPYSVIINVNMLSKLFENPMCRSCKISPLFVVLEGKYGFFYKVKCTFNVCEQLENQTYIKKKICLF